MNKGAKIIIFIILCFVIVVPLAAYKRAGGGAVMWIGAVGLLLIYKSMFGKRNKTKDDDKNDKITLNKDKKD